MDLIKLPEGNVTEEELKEIACPFAESILKMRWQSVAHPVVGTVLLTLLTILLLTGGGLMTYMGPRRFFAVMLTPCPCKRAQGNRNVIGSQTCDSTVDKSNQVEMKESAVGHEGGRLEVKDDTPSGSSSAPTNSLKTDEIMKKSQHVSFSRQN